MTIHARRKITAESTGVRMGQYSNGDSNLVNKGEPKEM